MYIATSCETQSEWSIQLAPIKMHRGTIVVKRRINVPLERTYAAYADAEERVRWAAPSDTAVFIYDQTDFRVGGFDLARCGAKDDPRFRVETRYINIVPRQRIVTADTVHDGDTLLMASITTMEFSGEAQSTDLKVTVQVTSFVGAAMIENTRVGNKGSLANMAQYLVGTQA